MVVLAFQGKLETGNYHDRYSETRAVMAANEGRAAMRAEREAAEAIGDGGAVCAMATNEVTSWNESLRRMKERHNKSDSQRAGVN